MALSGWWLALRVARREAVRNRGRTVLIVAMIALPVVGVGAADIMIRTAQLDNAEIARRSLGAADLSVQRIVDGPLQQVPGAYLDYRTEATTVWDVPTDPDLPAGSRVTSTDSGAVAVRTEAGARQAEAWTLDSDSPLVAGMVRLLDGRLPRADGEVAISPALAEHAGSGPGQRLWLSGGAAYDVVGLAVAPDDAGADWLLGRPGTVEFTGYDDAGLPAPVLLVDLPAGAEAIALGEQLNAAGFGVLQRDWLLHPPPTYVDPQQQALTIGLAVVTVGLALVQVVLLAGAAFAVGARRQRRALGLMAATGAAPRDIGRTILAGGLVLGMAAAGVGLVVAMLLARPLRLALEHLTGTLYGGWHLHWPELLAVAVLGVLSGLLAALVPARAAARQDPLRALLQRPDPPASGRRLTAAGLAMAAVGVATTVFGATRDPVSYYLILGGAVLVELGFVLCAPALVGAAGRLAGPLPVPLRMALRDASRHRSRSGPAVAAVMAALAGCVAVSIYFVSQDADAENNYVPTTGVGQVALYPNGGQQPGGALPPELQQQVTAALPGSELVSWQSVGPATPPGAAGSYLSLVGRAPSSGAAGPMQVAVGGPEFLRAALGRTDEAAEQALAGGELVVFGPTYVEEGRARLETISYDGAGVQGVTDTRDLPAYALPNASAYSYSLALLNPQAATDLDMLAAGAPSYVLDTARMPSDAELDRLTALSGDGNAFSFQVETGYDSPAGPTLLALLGASVVVVLGATGISTGLAAADGRADLSTLAAVGAAPRTRRLLAMSQAAVTAFLGAALGALAGFVPAAALISTLQDWPLTIPWPLIGATLVLVPMLAAGFAGLLTRSRLPMLRRLA